ncbi:MAG: arsenate reductase [Nitrospirae bacterium]|nr:MAG: arsenate reductase [Nitrospirota bacterium]
MARMTIYQKPTCITCRKVLKLLDERCYPYTTVNYYETPLTKTKLKTLLKKGGLHPKDVLRTHEAIYKTLGLARADKTEEELLDLLVQYPDLLQRPLVEHGGTVILARPPERVLTIL